MVRDSGVDTIYNEPNDYAKKHPEKYNIEEGSRDFRPHATTLQNKIFIPPFQTFAERYP